jgi:hypothetical protein
VGAVLVVRRLLFGVIVVRIGVLIVAVVAAPLGRIFSRAWDRKNNEDAGEDAGVVAESRRS